MLKNIKIGPEMAKLERKEVSRKKFQEKIAIGENISRFQNKLG
jgi:hypothetical protein